MNTPQQELCQGTPPGQCSGSEVQRWAHGWVQRWANRRAPAWMVGAGGVFSGLCAAVRAGGSGQPSALRCERTVG